VRVKRSQQQRLQQQGVLRARDDGLRRVRKITWRAGLLAAAAAAIAGARFAHLSPSLPHLPSDLTGGQASSSGQSGTISSGSSSSSGGVSSAGGGGQVTSGGS
jgi:uncharacterized membrane protein YgcG